MDLKLPDSTLRQYLKTKATAQEIAQALTACGPSVDRLNQIDGDWLYEIEVITNRVDCMSAIGIAREAAAILPMFGHKAVIINNPYDITSDSLPDRKTKKLPLNIQVRDPSLVKRFSLIILDNLNVEPSPKYISDQLNLAMIRPVNNLVDITNYLTLCFGQPVHVFDYDKILGSKILLRESKKGEKITTLDHKTHTLLGGDIVIEDGQGRLVDLCGIMGGLLSEVDNKTTRAIIFVQTYDPKKIRRTSLYTQERTLASQIFEKNPDTRLVSPTLIEGTNLFIKYANGRIASDSIDLYYQRPKSNSVTLNLKALNDHSGFNFNLKTANSILNNLGFTTKSTGDSIECKVPTWRLHDIEIPEDLIEEITRVYGYFRLDSNLPTSSYLNLQPDKLLKLEYQTKNLLSDLGFTEIFNYSLVSKDIFDKSCLPIESAVTLLNPLASEFEYLRPSLIPSLLMDLGYNQGKVQKPIRIFELSNIYQGTSSGLPDEISTLCLATTNLDYPTTKGYLEVILNKLGLDYKFTAIESFGPFRSNALSQIEINGLTIGHFGLIKTIVKDNFGIGDEVCLAQLDFSLLAKHSNLTKTITLPSIYPDIVDDVTIQSDKSIGQLINELSHSHPLITTVIYLESLANKHTFRLHFNNPRSNLTQEEVNQIKLGLRL